MAVTFIFAYFEVTPPSCISLTLGEILFVQNNAWKLAVTFCMSVLVSSHIYVLRSSSREIKGLFPCVVMLNCDNSAMGQKQWEGKFPVFRSICSVFGPREGTAFFSRGASVRNTGFH